MQNIPLWPGVLARSQLYPTQDQFREADETGGCAAPGYAGRVAGQQKVRGNQRYNFQLNREDLSLSTVGS